MWTGKEKGGTRETVIFVAVYLSAEKTLKSITRANLLLVEFGVEKKKEMTEGTQESKQGWWKSRIKGHKRGVTIKRGQ